MSILQSLSADNFITVNRTAASIVGLDAAVILGELASEALYWQQHKEGFDGWFFSTVENLEARTFLSGHSQRQAIQRLQDQGWIRVEKKGMPAKRYISINEEEIEKSLHDKSLNFLTTRRQKNERQDVQNFNDNKNIYNENIKEEKREDIQTPSDSDIRFLDQPASQEDIKKIIDVLLEAYPNMKNKIDKKGLTNLWYAHLGDNNADRIYQAVMNHIASNKFFPSIKEIQEELRRINYIASIPAPSQSSAPQDQERSDDCVDDILDQFND